MRSVKYVLTAVLVMTFYVSCGGEKKKEETKENIKIGGQKGEKVVESNVAEIVISGDDLMKFDLSEIKVKAGHKIKVTLRHKGKLDINVMGHNFVILKQGVNPVEFATKAGVARENQYIPRGTEDVLVHTKLIGGGQTTSIEFDAPAAGVYDFLCSFPGHYAMMKGKFIVE